MEIPQFHPGSYSDVSGHPASIRLWSLLNTEPWKIKMKAASDLGRPALEGVSEDILAEFEEQFTSEWTQLDRFKQMAGAMTKQVMEGEGYVFVRNNVPMSGTPFSRASKYRNRDAFKFHVWRLSTDPRLVGITSEKSASKLPTQQDGKWVHWKTVEGTRGDGKLHLCVAVGISDVAAALATLRDGGGYVERTVRSMRAA